MGRRFHDAIWLGAICAGVCAIFCAVTIIEAAQQPQIPPLAQQAPASPARTLPGQPTCIYCPRPDYSREAREKKIEGDVWLEALVTADGRAKEIKVTKSLGHGLDEEAIKAIKKWKFHPAVNAEGKPINAWTVIQVQFQLIKKSGPTE
ncbi:MAG TPA: energy transducer TonB [Candidatus Acidoferrum sp.]|nr:energy transducer TonB [Candidatus Acidoferrum sp.]